MVNGNPVKSITNSAMETAVSPAVVLSVQRAVAVSGVPGVVHSRVVHGRVLAGTPRTGTSRDTTDGYHHDGHRRSHHDGHRRSHHDWHGLNETGTASMRLARPQ